MYRVLVVEDEREANKAMCTYLIDAEYECIQAYNGKQALDILENEKIDMVILDIMMPEINGYEVLKELRNFSSIPVIMVTALGDECSEYDAFTLKADDYVVKPFSMRLLVERVNRLIRRVYGEMGGMTRIGDLEIDFDKQLIFYQNDDIKATAKEFKILNYLYSHQGQTVERIQLIDYLWGYDSYVDERVIDAHVKNLRKKIQVDLIKTVKGIGYRLVLDDENSI